MEGLRNKPLPDSVHKAMKQMLDAIKSVQASRMHERTNAMYPRDPNRLQEDRGKNFNNERIFCQSLTHFFGVFLQICYRSRIVFKH